MIITSIWSHQLLRRDSDSACQKILLYWHRTMLAWGMKYLRQDGWLWTRWPWESLQQGSSPGSDDTPQTVF